jgi:hypothetical protein
MARMPITASERAQRGAIPEAADPRKPYATPRLTRWGTIPRATRATDQDLSGLTDDIQT